MKDFVGNELQIGDEVVMVAPGYRMFCRGVIYAFTPKQARVRYNNTWNFGPKGYEQTILQAPGQLMKVIK